MIIKSIFRRYERWNPVHPTYGAFWGIGVGIGCGVGWGPGFGPEVVGYVGAGCGAGFSVGITLLGFGIGLPANYLLEVPHSGIFQEIAVIFICSMPTANFVEDFRNICIFVLAFTVTRRGALDVARAGLLLGKRSRAGDGLGDIIPHMSDVEQSPCISYSCFKIGSWTENIVDLADVKSMLVSNTKHIRDRFQRVSGSFFPRVRGKTE
ncbi:UNVERIFIED_CONTAM: Cadmium-induced protein AS8 [Sesamum radiatum]|uniref:Cadmium-induced protein AS8 n=1 Tax=Sesamum radiatum TaxID=300843 RepID=A0AAW2TU60_SESRA